MIWMHIIKTQFDQLSLDDNQQQKPEHQGKRGRYKAEQDNQGEDTDRICNSRCAVGSYLKATTIM